MAEGSAPRPRLRRDVPTGEIRQSNTYENQDRNNYRESWPIGNIRPVSADLLHADHTLTMANQSSPHREEGRSEAASWLVKVEKDEKEKKEPSILLLAAIFLSVFLSAVDISIVTTALPTMAEHMGAGQKGFSWIGSAYLLAGAASEPIWAKISDIFGRRPILMLANAVFLGGSVLCAISKRLPILLAGRVVQGLGSGGLLVLSNILIGDLFSPR